MADILHKPQHQLKPIDMEYKLRSFSTSTPILTRDMVSESKVIRSMSASDVNDSGFDESFTSCHDNTLCMDTPSTVCKQERLTPVVSDDSVLDQSFGSCPFSVKVNRFFETPGATFFSSPRWQSSKDNKQTRNCRQSVTIPFYSLDIDPESCHSLDIEPEPCHMECDSTPPDLLKKFDEVMQRFSPPEPERVIGRKMGIEHVDIISELCDRNISCSTILQYLHPRELRSMCEVSQKWKSACYNDPKARRRKNRFSPYKIKPGKENSVKKSPPKSFRGLTDSQNTLAQLQPLGHKTPSTIKVDLFQKVASTLKNEENLRKCPKCSRVSKVLPVQERGQCQNNDCQFDFCIKCFYEFHGSRPCIPVIAKKTKTDSIGGKKSKKNLRRL